MGDRDPKDASFRYWLVVGILFAFGVLTIFSIGLYLAFIAVALGLLAPFRSRPQVFLPGLALSLGFLMAYVLVGPWGCSQSFSQNAASGEETTSPVVCRSPIGIEYSGPVPFEPNRNPALIAGGVTATVAAAATWAVVRSKHKRDIAHI